MSTSTSWNSCGYMGLRSAEVDGNPDELDAYALIDGFPMVGATSHTSET
jgi:hypothetical protein